MSYHQFKNEEGEHYGSFEVFYLEKGEHPEGLRPGWYWWSCFPGCAPDGPAIGPFNTEQEAFNDAQGD